MKKNIVIAGGSGFIGQALIRSFHRHGHHLYILTRQASEHFTPCENIHYIQWMKKEAGDLFAKLPESIDCMINLSGASINSGRWTRKRKQLLLHSRLQSTDTLIRFIEQVKTKPCLLISASAVGIYGTSNTDTFIETSSHGNDDFLSYLASVWEKSALKAEQFGVRTVCARFGIVLGQKGGALPLLNLPYRLFIGGKIASGNQWLSWIHIEDLVQLILFIIDNQEIRGPVNFTSPNPVTMEKFGRIQAKVLKRPYWLNIPGRLVRLALGERSLMAIKGQRVLPQKALDAGFRFRFNDLEEALLDLLTKRSIEK
ncbi:TIGR01777 family oxidoreductase [Sporolactobacillus sp. CPB3-1]|uniref:TIGR01777 family oxidoreductase n=1 Tax=Sporolactobacillus mangiferae TaxID=2940498 RepID=A0ABT0M6T8_9BACL|nr:TIGR01777 family oxidoreductase [Sporolactobacillus mangiferae]MCL1630373.1 TIGR01777 family oxidoreductase [Sporolactobacillus mangiferae]